MFEKEDDVLALVNDDDDVLMTGTCEDCDRRGDDRLGDVVELVSTTGEVMLC